MTLFFVSQNDSPFYQSETFDHILSYVARNPRRCQFREQNGKRSMVITDMPTVESAVALLSQI
jgi:transcription-repair coupling factor (superfamily II helicase)